MSDLQKIKTIAEELRIKRAEITKLEDEAKEAIAPLKATRDALQEELLEDVLTAYVEAGIPGATIVDSEGMGRFLTYEIPLFADFKDFMKGNKPYNKTIFSVIREEKKVARLERLLDEISGGLDNPGTGILFTLPVDYAKGLIPEEIYAEDAEDEE